MKYNTEVVDGYYSEFTGVEDFNIWQKRGTEFYNIISFVGGEFYVDSIEDSVTYTPEELVDELESALYPVPSQVVEGLIKEKRVTEQFIEWGVGKIWNRQFGL